MKKYLYIYSFIIRKYLHVIALMILSFTATIVIFVMLLHIYSFYDFYVTIRAGFVPEVKVRFLSDITEDNMRSLIDVLGSSFTADDFRYGYIKDFEKAQFHILDEHGVIGHSFSNVISIIGLHYNAERQIEIYQNENKISAEVIKIDYFGGWIIDIKKKPEIKDVETHLIFGGRTLYLEPIDYGGYFSLFLKFPDNREQLLLMYSILTNFAERFGSLQAMGVPPNTFKENIMGDPDIHFRQVFIKPLLIACFKLALSDNRGEPQVLISAPLYSNISTYRYNQDTILDLEGRQHLLHVIDFFNINAERLYNNNAILLNYNTFQSLFQTKDEYNLLYIYGINLPIIDISNTVLAKYPDAHLLFRHDAIPELLTQKKIVESILYTLISIVFIVICCITIIRLFKFYMVFEREIVLLKTYGHKGYLFTHLFLFVLFVSAGVAYGIIVHIIQSYNDILTIYYFPEITFNPAFFYMPLVMCAAILIPASYIMERSQLSRGLSYSNIGDIT